MDPRREVTAEQFFALIEQMKIKCRVWLWTERDKLLRWCLGDKRRRK